MKKMRFSKKYILPAVIIMAGLTGCNKFLDREPLSNVTPSSFLHSEADLAAYTIARYNFPTHGGFNVGTFGNDNHTDNQAASGYATRWVPGEWRVPQGGGSWNFNQIRQVNYFLETVLPRWKEGKIGGNTANVNHYVGEAYFLRAYEYFNRIQALGDFPIIKTTLPDKMEDLTAASKRRPRNEVARFILSDLDSAIMLTRVDPPGGTNRISQYAALLLKSRVALHEGTWLLYHKGTAHVPGGPNWPGTGKVENFTINIDQEIDFFLTQAMDAAEKVADAIPLVENNMTGGSHNSSQNLYFSMFGDVNMSKYKEVLLWRAFDPTKGLNHNVNHYINRNGGNTGYTKGLVENFLMQNGLPIYAAGSGYAGDDYVNDVKVNRDARLQLFMKAPGELSYTDTRNANGTEITEGRPNIIDQAETRYVTGYAVKKGLSYIFKEAEGSLGSTGSIVFRAAEAYLNYMEASYLKLGAINSKAGQYWRALRTRAKLNPDYNITIAATSMAKEAEDDFAAYSRSLLLSDATLYNIRRERRTELIAEGMRYADLKRWRALDQLKTDPYIIEGFKLWGPMQDWYKNASGTSTLIPAETPGRTANVSKSSESPYLRPYRINLSASNLVRDGYRWAFAHYLDPIAVEHFLITTTDASDVNSSTLYQNPGWPIEANKGALN